LQSTLSTAPRPTIEPIPPGTDYFGALGLPRKLAIDLRDLERRYYDLSRRFHPDFFQSAPPRERLASLENSALVNKAYRTLRDPLARAEYLVRLEAGGEEIRAEAPQALFEEILELNELLAEYKLGEADEQVALRAQLQAKEQEFRTEYQELERRLTAELFPRWDRGTEAGGLPEAQKTALLGEIGRIIGNRAYLRRVLGNLEAVLSPELSS
jgi:molecular chaperone HscB